MNDQYMRLTYEDYKNLEDQLRRWEEVETTHRTVDGGYHKALRLRVTPTLIIEFQGPLIKPPLSEVSSRQYTKDKKNTGGGSD